MARTRVVAVEPLGRRMMYDDSVTRRIQQAFDIADLVGEHVKLIRAGKDFKGLCPFHQEKTPSFYVVPSKQIFKCFGCGVGGDVFKFVQLREKVGFVEAKAILAAKAGISLESRRSQGPSESDKAALAKLNEWAVGWFQKNLRESAAARAYAEQRGLTPETIEAFSIGFAPQGWDGLVSAARGQGISTPLLVTAGLVKPRPTDGGVYDAFRNRLMFPIRDSMQRVIGFGGRTLGDDPAKYLNTAQTPLFDKGRSLYGIDRARDAIVETGRAVLVEGYLDCVMAHQFGFRNTVATLGTALSNDHATLLRRYAETAILLLDSDAAGERAAERALPIFLSQRLDVRLCGVPEGKDPADYLLARGREGLQIVLNSAVDALEFKWSQLQTRYRGSSGVVGRRQAVEEFLSIVVTAVGSGSFDAIQRGLIANQVGKLLGLEAEDVQRQLAQSDKKVGPNVGSSHNTRASNGASQGVAAIATRELLEVLLNEPSYFPSVASSFDASALGDESLQRVGELVVEAANRSETFDVQALLASIESLSDAQRLVDLQMAGHRRGNYAATVDGALRRLEQERNRREAERLSDFDARLTAAREHRHFAARKHLNRSLVDRSAPEGSGASRVKDAWGNSAGKG